MSDFDKEDVVEETAANNDFDAEDMPQEDIPREQMSMAESALKGAEQGLTFGTADELGGGLQATLDFGQRIANQLGLASPSPTQVAEQLAQSGVSGDVGPKSTLDLYREARDQARQTYAQAAEDNPTSNLVGNVAGGFLFGGGAGTLAKASGVLGRTGRAAQVALNPLPAAKNANLLTKVGKGAVSAIPASLAAGAGFSEADLTQGDISGLAGDLGDAGQIGLAVGGGIPLVGAGLRGGANLIKSAGNLLPDSVTVPFRRAAEAGTDLANPNLYDEVQGRLTQVTDEVSEPITQKQAALRATQEQMDEAMKAQRLAQRTQMQQTREALSELKQAKKQELSKNFSKQIQETETKLATLGDDVERGLALEQQKQVTQNAQLLKNLDNEAVDTAKSVQTKLGELKTALGKQFDEIEAAADKTNIKPDNREAVSFMEQELTHSSGLPESEVAAIMKRLTPDFGKKDYQSFQNMRTVLRKYFEHANPVVRRTAKQAYGQLNDSYAKSLRESGQEALANRIADTNQRWAAAMQLEDRFVSGTTPNRLTKEMYASGDTLSTVKAFGRENPQQIAASQEFQGLMKRLDPEAAAQVIDEMEFVASRTKQAKDFKPQLPSKEEVLAQNPEAQKLTELLNQLKDQSKDVSSKLKQDPDYQQLMNQLKTLREASAKGTTLDTPEIEALRQQGEVIANQLDQFLPTSSTGKPQQTKDQVMNLVQKYGRESKNRVAENRLDNILNFLKQERGDEYVQGLQTRMKDVAEDAYVSGLRGQKVATAANVAGKVVRKAAKPIKDVNAFLRNGVNKLSNASPESMEQLAAGFEASGERGQKYAQILRDIQNKNTYSRNAMIFSLMQQPEFRETFHEVNGSDFEDEDQ